MDIQLEKPISLVDLLAQINVPIAEIAIAAVNGTLVSLHEAQVADEDQVELHPPNGGG